MLVGYLVLDRNGKLKRRSKYKYGPPRAFYVTLGQAKAAANEDGDSVVPVEVDSDREPLFIRSKKL